MPLRVFSIPPCEQLTSREIEVLNGISQGYTSEEIAAELFISAHTVISYRKTLLRKLNALNAPSMVRKGFEMGILTGH